jgi:mono/diheme cytochrome c family protein
MKMFFQFRRIFFKVIIVFLAVSSGVTSFAQTKHSKQFPIPDSINTVFQASCMSCHGVRGGRFPRARINFAGWNQYNASKQAEKALLICSAIRKGAMPPKSIRESRPDLIPTKEQIDMICKWAQSLKPARVKKQMIAN